jgi:hypothetical protein
VLYWQWYVPLRRRTAERFMARYNRPAILLRLPIPLLPFSGFYKAFFVKRSVREKSQSVSQDKKLKNGA